MPVDQFDIIVNLDSINNGIQFSPQTSSDTIKAFDNFYQRHFEYTYDRDDKIDGPQGSISVKVYKEKQFDNSNGDDLKKTPPNTLSLGPAFSMNMVMAK